jgi:outer membrane protein TolC
MKRTLAVIVLLAAPMARASTVLTFDQVLSRAARARALPAAATNAADLLERGNDRDFPTVRAETSVSSADNLDLFTQNILRFNAFTALVSVDYPLRDGGVRALQRQSARIDALTFRERMREMADELFRETVEAVARLYTAQERLRLLASGMQRALDLGDRARRMLDVREISNVTAAQWEDESIAAEGQRLDLELQRLEAETHVKQLIADTTSDPIEVTIDVDNVRASDAPQPATENRASLLLQRRELAAEEAEASGRTQVLLSGFGGVASVGGGRQYGLYGVRMNIALPMFDASARRHAAEARLEAEESRIERDVAEERVRLERESLAMNAAALRKRIALLTQAVGVSRQREQSTTRLVSAGVRPAMESARAAAERTRRESDLLAARVDLWKVAQLMRREGVTVPQLAAP